MNATPYLITISLLMTGCASQSLKDQSGSGAFGHARAGSEISQRSVSSVTQIDSFTGRGWWSRFEACMCEDEAPMIFHEGTVYLYNRAHASVRNVGSYDIREGSAILRSYRSVETHVECSILSDHTLVMSVDPIVIEMGLRVFVDKEPMPWSMPEITNSKMIKRAMDLINKQEK